MVTLISALLEKLIVAHLVKKDRLINEPEPLLPYFPKLFIFPILRLLILGHIFPLCFLKTQCNNYYWADTGGWVV